MNGHRGPYTIQPMRFVALLAAALAGFALAQAPLSQCATKCNTTASECMKVCTGDPKDASKPGKADGMMKCMKACEDTLKQCKSACPADSK